LINNEIYYAATRFAYFYSLLKNINLSENKYALNNLAYFLIDTEINLVEGISLAEKEFQTDFLNAQIRGTLGWGYYKRNNPEKAMELLQKADAMTAKFDSSIRKHLQRVQDAMANQ
jgi:hypothetical protein